MFPETCVFKVIKSLNEYQKKGLGVHMLQRGGRLLRYKVDKAMMATVSGSLIWTHTGFYSSPPTQCLTLEKHSWVFRDACCEISTEKHARHSYQSSFTFLCSLSIRRALHKFITEQRGGREAEPEELREPTEETERLNIPTHRQPSFILIHRKAV